MKKKLIITISLVTLFIGILFATTWTEINVKCPVCNTKNEFMSILSYGSYIYDWPSKYQFIYWPVTETYSVYSCKKCKYSAFMWDFNSLSGDTLIMIKDTIKSLEINLPNRKDYSKIPCSKKLEAAEETYKLYMTDLDFWSRFYRIKGYHHSLDKNESKALTSRLLAIEYTNKLLQDSSNIYRKKELLYTTGAMKYFTSQDSLAIIDFREALKNDYIDPTDSSYDTGYNEYLDKLIKDFILAIVDEDETFREVF